MLCTSKTTNCSAITFQQESVKITFILSYSIHWHLSTLLYNHSFCSKYHINLFKSSLHTKFKKSEHMSLFVGFAQKQGKFACLAPCITRAILFLYYYFHILAHYKMLSRAFCCTDAPHLKSLHREISERIAETL